MPVSKDGTFSFVLLDEAEYALLMLSDGRAFSASGCENEGARCDDNAKRSVHLGSLAAAGGLHFGAL